MTPREKFILALEGNQPPGLVPHFELVFYLTMEAFGKVHPVHRCYSQWDQMQENERQLHREDMADIYVETAERFEHSAIFMHPNPNTEIETLKLIDTIREKSGDKYFLMLHGDATYEIPNGSDLLDFSYRIGDEPENVKKEADQRVNEALERAEIIAKNGGIDGFALCSDYCFNTGPFMSPNQFSEFITPYLAKLVKGYRQMGFYSIKHTDGNIMPVIDQVIQAGPDALHSLDPQGGVDIKQIKKQYGKQLCLIGNVNCGILDTGTCQEVGESVKYALKNGMPGGGYIFSTSNCIYTGMRLERYEKMLEIWKKEGVYDSVDCEQGKQKNI